MHHVGSRAFYIQYQCASVHKNPWIHLLTQDVSPAARTCSLIVWYGCQHALL